MKTNSGHAVEKPSARICYKHDVFSSVCVTCYLVMRQAEVVSTALIVLEPALETYERMVEAFGSYRWVSP